MLIWLFYERVWTLALGGAAVGYLTNWLALKLIFEPIEPTRWGVVGGGNIYRCEQKSHLWTWTA